MRTILKILVSFMLFMSISFFTIADMPPPPGEDPSTTGGTPVGGGAPLGGGLVISLILGAAYASKRILTLKKIKE